MTVFVICGASPNSTRLSKVIDYFPLPITFDIFLVKCSALCVHHQKFNTMIIFQKVGKEKILWHQIDRVSRVVFPVVFFVFNILYWVILICNKNKTNA